MAGTFLDAVNYKSIPRSSTLLIASVTFKVSHTSLKFFLSLLSFLRYQHKRYRIIFFVLNHIFPQRKKIVWKWKVKESGVFRLWFHMAYFLVHSFPSSVYFSLSVLYSLRMRTVMKCKINVESVVSRGLALPGNLRNKRIIRIRITQKRTDWEENFGDGEGGGPLRSEHFTPSDWLYIFSYLRISRQMDPLELMFGW